MDPPRQNSGLIVDRFNALIRVKDDVVQVYEELLLELTINSKPIITDLTMIAGEQREYAEGIADAILARISEVPVDQKLPALYLLDSIAKNIGHEYVRYFGERLPEVFCEAYNQVNPSMHPSMRHLFKTWSQVFPSSVLRTIESELLLSSTVETQRPHNQTNVRSSSPSPHTSHGIHVNPKYLEAQQAAIGAIGSRKTMHVSDREDGVESLPSKSLNGWSGASPKIHDDPLTSANISRPRSYNQNLSTKYSAYDYNRPDNLYIERSRIVNDPIDHVNVRLSKPLSPSRIRTRRSTSPMDYNFQRDDSFLNPSEKAYQPQSRLEYEHSTGYNKKHLRELIDTYGNHISQSTSVERPLKLQRIDVNGNNVEKVEKNWLNRDEEEYVWEDMSPTLSSKRTSLPFGRVGVSRPDANSVDPELRYNKWNGQATSQHPVGDPAMIKDDRFPIIGALQSGHGSMHMKFSDARVGQNEQFGRSHNFQHASGETTFSRAWRPSPPFPLNGVAGTNSLKMPDVELPYQRSSSIHNTGSSHLVTSIPEKHSEFRPPLYPPPLPKSQPLPSIPPPPIPNQFQRSYDVFEPNMTSSSAPNSYQNAAPMHTAQRQNQHSGFHGGYFPPPLPQSIISQTHMPPIGDLINKLPQIASTDAIQKASGEGVLHGKLPVSSHMAPATQNTLAVSSSPVSAFSGLISNLMAQGVISLTPPAKTEDSVGLEFNTELLKVRHESAINALYTNLPRQCTTCGLRFKCQEEHSTHMDWHVTKNRISKNRKQKPSRKWFVNTKEWMSGAETVGTEVVPFLPEETVAEKEEKEMNVPADDNQTTCALCGELFEDFYSDEAEEWMYKGAVYMNAPDGNIYGLDRSMLGPIVHAKCRSDSGECS